MSNLSHVAFFFFFSTKHNGNNRGFHERTINSQETLDNFFYLGQFGRRWALRDDCQAAVLLHRQAGEAAAESSTGMSNQKCIFFFSLSLNLRAWIEIFSLKAAASSAFRLSRQPLYVPKIWINTENGTEGSTDATFSWTPSGNPLHTGHNRQRRSYYYYYYRHYFCISITERRDKFNLACVTAEHNGQSQSLN